MRMEHCEAFADGVLGLSAGMKVDSFAPCERGVDRNGGNAAAPRVLWHGRQLEWARRALEIRKAPKSLSN